MMPVTTISATPLSANGTVSTGWIYIADGLYSNVGVVAGADTTGTINILFSADGSTTLVEMIGVCNTSNIMNNGVMVQGVLQYGGYSNLGIVNSLLIAPYMKIEYVNGSTAQTEFIFGYYFYGKDDYIFTRQDAISPVDAGFTKIINYALNDAAALSDLGKQLLIAIRKVDSITLSDALHYILGLLMFDNGVSLSDTAVYNLNKVFLDNFGIHDLGTRLLISKAYLEHLNITDALIKNLQIKNTDYFGISDMHNKAIAVVNTELAELRDFINKEVAVGFEELAPVIDRGAIPILFVQDIMMYVTNILNAAGVPTMILYNIKAVDIQRTGTFAAVWKNSEQDTYIGFGREAFGDYSITADLWVYGGNNRFHADSIISKIHSIVEDYHPGSQSELSNGDVFVWIKLISEENIQSKYRGALLYRFVFQCRVWRKMNE